GDRNCSMRTGIRWSELPRGRLLELAEFDFVEAEEEPRREPLFDPSRDSRLLLHERLDRHVRPTVHRIENEPRRRRAVEIFLHQHASRLGLVHLVTNLLRAAERLDLEVGHCAGPAATFHDDHVLELRRQDTRVADVIVGEDFVDLPRGRCDPQAAGEFVVCRNTKYAAIPLNAVHADAAWTAAAVKTSGPV